jgi:hypothetical protein
MFKTSISRKWLVLTVAAAAVALSAGLGAYAAIPDAGGVIHGCYHVNGQGQVDGSANLRVIDPASTNKDGKACKKDETALDWNQQGIPGPQGPQGVPGPQGPQGPQGPPGAGHAYVSDPNSHEIEQNGDQEIVGLSGLSAGSYLVFSPIDIVGDDSGFNGTCIWRINDDPNQFRIANSYTFIYDSADTSFGRAPMLGVVSIPDDNSSLKAFCTTSSDNHPVASGQMIAVKLGAVN